MSTLPLLLLVALGVPAAACDASASAAIADHRSVDEAARIPEGALERVRTLAAVVARPSAGSALVRGLQRLAQRQPERYALRVEPGPTQAWLAAGGVGSYSVGKGFDPTSRAQALAAKVDAVAKGRDPDVATLEFAPEDLPSSGRVEVCYRQYSVDADVSITHASLTGSFTDTISAPRVIGGGGGAGGGAVTGPLPFPIELPNVAVDHVSTHVRLPAGIGPDAVSELRTVAEPSPRDPRVALGAHRDAMAAIAAAHPRTALVYATMPLKPDDNRQREFFNAYLRGDAAAHGRPLLDIADIQAHDAGGALAMNSHGPVLAADWVKPGTTAMGDEGEIRLAKAWWVLMARVSGWDGK